MSTFTDNATNAKATGATVDKDAPTAAEIKAADDAATGQTEIPASDPNEPVTVVEESAGETADRHVASAELPVGLVTPPETQADTALAEDAKELIVPGAAVGPEVDGTVRNDHGKVAHAPAGSLNAAFNGVQRDAAGHVDSVGTDNSSASGTRI